MKSIITESMAADSGLHDYETVSFCVDYSASRVEIYLRDARGCGAELVICPFSELNITHREPWGKGSYIVSSELLIEENDKALSFELNSGDSITIRYK
ncbi:MAG: hypothetical protein IKW96_14650 [Ruminococcus sp.]|uniref:hypothetical protein n=1 Tax=Ruminococcus sp. TaxID=41978 RepID=UPI0025EB575B|nr:hypothetical protein [Ruminococcus sp.]MBR5684491.1 hypothetical protein [Ruminococcus sp.]